MLQHLYIKEVLYHCKYTMLQSGVLVYVKILCTEMYNGYMCQYMCICICRQYILIYVHTCVFRPVYNL